jgi:hypothetical protein
MNIVLLLGLALLVVGVSSSSSVDDIETTWRLYKQRLGKVFSDTESEKSRKADFAKNYEFIRTHNEKENVGFKLNPLDLYNDMNLETFVKVRTGLKRSANKLLWTTGQSGQPNHKNTASARSYPTSLGKISDLGVSCQK